MRGRSLVSRALVALGLSAARPPITRASAIVVTRPPAVVGRRGAGVVRSVPARRRPAIARSVYAGAHVSRLTSDFITSILSADQEIRGDLRLLRARSRALARDNPHAVQFRRLLKSNVAGPDGIRLQARIRLDDGGFDRARNTQVEAAFAEWSLPGTCTIDGLSSFIDVQHMLLDTLATDGEFLLRRRIVSDRERNPFGYALQLLDPDLLDEGYNTTADAHGNRISMGVEKDPDGRPLAYHVWSRHPADSYEGVQRERYRIPASEIIHGFIPLRAGQTRGVPWFAPVLLQMRMLDGYFEAETVAARLAAMKQGFIQTAGAADGFQEPREGESTLQMDAEPGQLHQLLPGQTFESWDPQHPTQAFDPFTSALLRAIAAGLGASYTGLTGDLSGANYSSMRVGLLQERDVWKTLHRWLTEHTHRPIYWDWLKFAATTGAVQLPTLEPARWRGHLWMPRGYPWVDPLNDVQADAIALRLGLTTRTRLCAERGLDFEELLEQRAEEQDLAEEYGVTLTTDFATPSKKVEDDSETGAGKPTSADADRILPLRAARSHQR